MRIPGLAAGASLAAGIFLSSTVVPLPAGPAAGGVALAVAAALRSPRAWPAVPFALGFLRDTVDRARFERLRVREPALVRGFVVTRREDGDARILQAGPRRFRLSEPPPGVPPPGWQAPAMYRGSELISRADPSAFDAGQWARVRGFHGRARVVSPPGEPRPAPGLRAWLDRTGWGARERTRARLGGRRGSDLVLALVLGDRAGLGDDERERFRRAGLAHVLALSGMHVGILALGGGALLRALRVPRAAAAVLVVCFLVAFAFLTGAQPPILRAVVTGSLAALAPLAGRASAPLNALGIAGAALLVARPALLFDAGFRLSFLATGMLSIAASRRSPPGPGHSPRARRLRGLAGAVGLSAVVTLATLPVLASAFGRVSLLSPVSNLVAGPPAAGALGWGALAALVPGPLAAPLADAAAQSARALSAVSRAASPLPGADLTLPAPGPAGAVLLVALAALLAAGRRPRGRGLAALGLLALLECAGRLPSDRLTALDVGQGDAFLLERGGHAVLVDGGLPDAAGADSPAARAVRHRRWRRLDAVVVTHGDRDHAGGLSAVVPRARALLEPARHVDARIPSSLARLHEAAAAAGIPRRTVDAWRHVTPGVEVRASRAEPPPDAPENDLSLATRWRAGPVSAWLLGDAPASVESTLVRSGALGAATFLPAPHHGSRDSGSELLLRTVRPALVLVSCGRGNPHGHPHEELLGRVRASGAALRRTDRDGTITVHAVSGGFRLRWERGFPGPRALFPPIPLPAPGPHP
jgi:competence protein ComEC